METFTYHRPGHNQSKVNEEIRILEVPTLCVEDNSQTRLLSGTVGETEPGQNRITRRRVKTVKVKETNLRGKGNGTLKV